MVDPRELQRLEEENHRFRASGRRWRLGLCLAVLACSVSTALACWQSSRLTAAARESRECRKNVGRSKAALSVLTLSQERILAATERAPSVGTKSWGRRFTVTQYTPRSPKYGKFDRGVTATLTKADPRARIVAVDPQLIPYGSWVWVEDLGWFRAEDTGAAIKGFRLDLLTDSEEHAMAFGKQLRFVMVVPADA